MFKTNSRGKHIQILHKRLFAYASCFMRGICSFLMCAKTYIPRTKRGIRAICFQTEPLDAFTLASSKIQIIN